MDFKEEIKKTAWGRGRWLAVWLASFILGIAAVSNWGRNESALFVVYVLLWAGVAAVVFFWKRGGFWRGWLIMVLFFLTGVARLMLSEPLATPNNSVYYHGRQVELAGQVINEPEFRDNQRVILRVETLRWVNSADAGWRKVAGSTMLFLPLYPAREMGEKIIVRCQLAPPGRDYNFASRLSAKNVWSICFGAEVVSSQAAGKSFFVYLAQLRKKLIGHLGQMFHEPQAALLAGILFGGRAGLAPAVQTNFNRVGISHIVAVSGYNVVVVLGAMAGLLRWLGCRRQRVFWLLALVLALFVIFTGASASVVRAGLTAFMALSVQQIGRPNAGGRALLLAAAVMLIYNPRYLFFDLGFQLSFLATIGLIYLNPILEKRLGFLPEKFGFKESLLTTLSAIIFTTPLILHSFGRFSVVAPMVNFLVLPVIPMVMGLGALTAGLSFIFAPLGQLVGWLVWWLLSYIIKVAEWFAGWPWASWELPPVPWWLALLVYVCLWDWTYRRRKKEF